VAHKSRGLPTQADGQLLGALTQRGFQISATQLKGWRAAGLLPTPQRTARGRGRGRTSDAYPTGTVDRASVIAELVAKRVPLSEVHLRLFARGHEVEEELIVSSYWKLLDWLRGLADESEGGSDALAQAMRQRAKRNAFGRRWIRRAGTYGARRGSVVENALVALTTLFFDDDDYEPSVEAKAALGIVAGTSDAESLVNTISKLNLDGLEMSLEYASGDHFRQARDIYLRSRDVVKELALLQPVEGMETIPPELTDKEMENEFGDIIGMLAMCGILDERPEYEAELREFEAAINDAKAVLSRAPKRSVEHDCS